VCSRTSTWLLTASATPLVVEFAFTGGTAQGRHRQQDGCAPSGDSAEASQATRPIRRCRAGVAVHPAPRSAVRRAVLGTNATSCLSTGDSGDLPGSAEMIFREFELQGTHRRALERKIVSGNERRATTGQWLGGAIALFFLAAAVWLVLADHDAAGIAIGTVDLGGLVAVFVIGSLRRRPTDD